MRHCSAICVFAALLSLSSTPGAQTIGTLAKVKESGVIVLGHREASIPFAYLAGTEPVGFSMDICQKIVDEVKKATGRSDLVVRKQTVTAANRIPLIQNGTIDMECGSTTNNSERNKQVAFSTNLFYTGSSFLVKVGSPVKSIADLKGLKVAAQAGTTNILVLRKLDREMSLNVDLVSTKDHTEGLLLLESDRVQAYMSDDVVLYGLRANARHPEELAVVGDPIQVEPYAIILRKDDPAFKAVVDGVIANLMKSGEFHALYKKWFQSSIPPRGINLNATLSPVLDASLRQLSDKPRF